MTRILTVFFSLFYNVYPLRFLPLTIVYYPFPRDANCRWKALSSANLETLFREIFEGKFLRSGPRLLANSGKRFGRVVKAGRSRKLPAVNVYSDVPRKRGGEKEWSRLSKRVKDFYDRPLETRFIAALRSVPLRSAERRGWVVGSLQTPRETASLRDGIADETPLFYVHEWRKKKEKEKR